MTVFDPSSFKSPAVTAPQLFNQIRSDDVEQAAIIKRFGSWRRLLTKGETAVWGLFSTCGLAITMTEKAGDSVLKSKHPDDFPAVHLWDIGPEELRAKWLTNDSGLFHHIVDSEPVVDRDFAYPAVHKLLERNGK